ncbi:uncharacterized protein LOC127708139 [Mytilus californianus]|uniref:uncharacterized protein LOC127708139 n=1 Tax=Mytilus californianus TaxID=6549 RepID=UPI00224838B6|nr:uncharacterized protein LOC127708139 [Mytilus californianus]
MFNQNIAKYTNHAILNLSTLDTSDEKISDDRTTTPANNREKALTVTSDETVSGGRTATPANNGEKSLTDLPTLVTSDEKVSDGRTATPANNGEKSLTDLFTLVSSDEKVSDGRTATPANNGEKSLKGQIHTITGAMIGVMSSAVILYHAAPIMKGLLKLVSKTADEEITQKEVEDQVSDTIAIATLDIDEGILFTRRIDIWSVPPISHSDVVS